MLFLCDTAILLQSTEKLILCIPVVFLSSLNFLLNKKLIKLLCFMNQISILTRCPQVLENLQICYPTHVQKRLSKFRKQGSRNLPLPWSSSPPDPPTAGLPCPEALLIISLLSQAFHRLRLRGWTPFSPDHPLGTSSLPAR